MTHIKRLSIYLICILLLLGLVGIKWFFLKPSTSSPATRSESRGPDLTVSTLELRPESISDRITTNGTVLANESIELRTEISGKVVAIHFTEGSLVEKNALLLKMDDSELKARELSYQHRVTLAQAQAKRQEQLLERKMASQEDYDTIMSELNIARAELQLVEVQISKTEIRAPFAGVIGLRSISEGSYITPGITITTLADKSAVRIEFSVSEKYSGLIGIGSPISFRVQSQARSFEATVAALDTSIDPITRSWRMQARASNDDELLIPGSFAQVIVPLPERLALMAPTSAIIPELKGHRAFILQEGKAVSRSIEIGIRTEDRLEIASGLKEGDVLITSGILQLRDGVTVQPQRDQSSTTQPESPAN